jgi:DNA-binding transcriptional LysR family regulator
MVAMFEVLTMSSNAVLVSGAQKIDAYSGVVNGLTPDGLSTTHGWRERLVLAVPTGHALSRKQNLRYEDLEDQPLIVYARTSGSRMGDCIVSILRRRNVNAQIVYEGAEADTIIGLVAARRGLALVPTAWSTFSLNGVQFRPIGPTQFLPGLAFYWNPDVADPLVRAFVDSAVKSIDATGPVSLRRAAS